LHKKILAKILKRIIPKQTEILIVFKKIYIISRKIKHQLNVIFFYDQDNHIKEN